MYSADIGKIKQQLNEVLSFVDLAYIDALLLLHDTFENEHVGWAVGGDLGEALETIQVEPDHVEIVANKDGTEKIFSAVKEYNPKPIELQTIKLARNAKINGIEKPIYIQSYFFEFFLGCVNVRVYGDMQYKINDWDWGDKLEFTPEYVNIMGVKIAVIPLEVKYQIYQNLGWTDRSEKIEPIIKRRKQIPKQSI